MRKNVIIGVCGGISSYKSVELVRLLVKNNYSTKVVMTDAAAKFVTPLTFQTLSSNPVYMDMFYLYKEQTEHISLADWASICVIAPLSANTLSKITHGVCDNLLTTIVCALSQRTKILCAPAMNENMWKNPIIQGNVKRLKNLKRYIFMKPLAGELACGAYGQGRMAEPKDIFSKIRSLMNR